MAQTPFVDLKSEDILSAHLSGIQHAVNKVESALNMKTASVTGHALNGVADQDDASLHRYVYEGTIRNWLLSPAPVIKRNGVVVSTSEYKLKAAYGTIVFNAQQAAGDTITADFSYVVSDSTAIDNLEDRATQLESTASALDSRVTTLEVNGGGSGGSGGATVTSAPTNMLFPKTSWISNNKDSTATTAVDVAIAGNTIDAFPIMISENTTITNMKTIVGTNNAVSANVIMGIYDNKDAAPNKLLGTTGVFRIDVPTVGDVVKPLLNSVILVPGIYWVVRYANDGLKLNGWNSQGLYDFYTPDTNLINTNTSTGSKVVGVRSGSVGSISALPDTFPAVGTGSTSSKYLQRPYFGGVYAQRG